MPMQIATRCVTVVIAIPFLTCCQNAMPRSPCEAFNVARNSLPADAPAVHRLEVAAVRGRMVDAGFSTTPPVDRWRDVAKCLCSYDAREQFLVLTLASEVGAPAVMEVRDMIPELRLDLFVWIRVCDNVIKEDPSNGGSAELSLFLYELTEGRDLPGDIDVHGLTAEDIVAQDVLPSVWAVPEELLLPSQRAGLREWVRKTLSARMLWTFNESRRMWEVAEAK